MLCWWGKKEVWGAPNLHELPGITAEAIFRELSGKRNFRCQQFLFPMPAVFAPDKEYHLIFNKDVGLLNRLTVLTVFAGQDDLTLILKRNPRIWDKNVQQQGMCLSAMGTTNTLNL